MFLCSHTIALPTGDLESSLILIRSLAELNVSVDPALAFATALFHNSLT
jgi:hypothetical protein